VGGEDGVFEVDQLAAEGVLVDGNDSDVCVAEGPCDDFCGSSVVGDGDCRLVLLGSWGGRGGVVWWGA
jgi:hypothetical protein